MSPAATLLRSKPLTLTEAAVSGIPSQVLSSTLIAGKVTKISPSAGISATVVKAIVKLPDWVAITKSVVSKAPTKPGVKLKVSLSTILLTV